MNASDTTLGKPSVQTDTRGCNLNITLLSTVLLLSFCLTSCSGGSSNSASPVTTNPENEPTGMDDPMPGEQPEPGSMESGIAVLPANSNQPNSVSPDVAEDSNGRLHAVYSDIDGRAFYANCSTNCQSAGNWNSVELFQSEIDNILGYMVPKVRIDQNNAVHVAYVINYDGGSVFARQELYYGFCENTCNLKANWNGSIVHDHPEGHLESELQNYDWFAVTESGQPRAVFVEPESGLFGDTFLYYLACNTQCDQPGNWSKQPLNELELASSKPTSIAIGSDGVPHLIVNFEVIGANSSQLLSYKCVDACDAVSPLWSDAVDLQTINEDLLNPYSLDFSITADNRLRVGLMIEGDNPELVLWTCDTNCGARANWQSAEISDDIPLPENIVSLQRDLSLRVTGNQVEIGLIGKRREVNVPSVLIKASCEENCLNGNWRYTALADTADITFDNVGICLFIGTAATGPLKLLDDGIGFGLYPHWGCNTGPVEIIEPDGNTYIDYNADVRFYEVAAFAK